MIVVYEGRENILNEIISQLIFGKSPKDIQQERSLFNKQCQENWTS